MKKGLGPEVGGLSETEEGLSEIEDGGLSETEEGGPLSEIEDGGLFETEEGGLSEIEDDGTTEGIGFKPKPSLAGTTEGAGTGITAGKSDLAGITFGTFKSFRAGTTTTAMKGLREKTVGFWLDPTNLLQVQMGQCT